MPAAPAVPAAVQGRFARATALDGIGTAGQRAIESARVVVVGAGGLGSAVLPVLAAAGVGVLTIVDDDVVEVSNLARQVLHTAADVGRSKVDSAVLTLRPLATGEVRGTALRVDTATAGGVVAGADLVVDATDSPEARYALDDACASAGVPLVWGSAVGWTGQVGVADARRGPRWRDLFPVPPDPDALEVCAVAGVLPSLCTTVGGLMATEVLKLVTGAGAPLIGRLLVVDALRGTVRAVAYSAAAYGAADTAPGAAEGSARMGAQDRVEPRTVQRLLAEADVQVVDVREPSEVAIAALPGATVIPLGELAARMSELDPGRPVIVSCHHGPRSQRGAAELAAAGFTTSWMRGGIDAWSLEVDPSVPRY